MWELGERPGWEPRLSPSVEASFLENGLDFHVYSGDWKLIWFVSGMGPSADALGAGGQGKAVRQMTTLLQLVLRGVSKMHFYLQM